MAQPIGVDPQYHGKQMTLALVRLTKVELANEHLWKWIQENAPTQVQKLNEEVAQIGLKAELAFQKKLGALLREFGVENPL